MALPTCNEDMNIISKLDDEPNDVGGLSAAALKAKFDLAGNLLKRRSTIWSLRSAVKAQQNASVLSRQRL